MARLVYSRRLRYRLAKRKHAVIVVAEGAGQDLMNEQHLGKGCLRERETR